jgi:hypothetical protein
VIISPLESASDSSQFDLARNIGHFDCWKNRFADMRGEQQGYFIRNSSRRPLRSFIELYRNLPPAGTASIAAPAAWTVSAEERGEAEIVSKLSPKTPPTFPRRSGPRLRGPPQLPHGLRKQVYATVSLATEEGGGIRAAIICGGERLVRRAGGCVTGLTRRQGAHPEIR